MARLTNSHHGSSVAHSVSAEHRPIGERQAAIGRGIHTHARIGSAVATLPMDRPSSGRALASEPSHQASSPPRWTSRTVAHGRGAVKVWPPSRSKTAFTTRHPRSCCPLHAVHWRSAMCDSRASCSWHIDEESISPLRTSPPRVTGCGRTIPHTSHALRRAEKEKFVYAARGAWACCAATNTAGS